MQTTIDTLLGGKVRIMQFERGFKVSSDAVLLASVIDKKIVKKRTKMLDVGVGSGGVAMCVLHRFDDIHITGIDIQDELLKLARETAVLNKVDDRFEAFHANILHPDEKLRAMSGFDIVVTNPPYYKGMASPDSIKAKAHAEGEVDLSKWISESVKRMRSNGVFAMVHKAERIDDILAILKSCKIGRIEIFPVASRKGENAMRIIVRGVKGSASPAVLHSPIILHNPDGSYSNLAMALLERGEELSVLVEEMVGL